MSKMDEMKNSVKDFAKKALDATQNAHSTMAALAPKDLREIQSRREEYYKELKHDDDIAVTKMNEYAMMAYKAYLPFVSELYVPVKEETETITNIENMVSYFDIKKWSFDKEEKNIEKLANVYQILSKQECNIALIYDRTREVCNVRMAVCNTKDNPAPTDTSMYIERLKKSILGNFPGVNLSESQPGFPINCVKEDGEEKFFYNIAAVSNMASDKSDSFISQNMEKLIDGIVPKDDTENYTIVLLATPNNRISEYKTYLSSMYSELSSFSQWQTNKNVTEGSMLGAAVNVGANAGFSAGVRAGVNFIGSGDINFGFQGGINISKSMNKMENQAKTEGITYSITNYSVKHLLENIEAQIKRLDESEALGLWDFAAYVISPDPIIAEDVAHMYLSLTQGKDSFASKAAVNVWNGGFENEIGDGIKVIADSISRLKHPVFSINRDVEDYSFPFPIDVTTSLSGKELARALNFPRRSIAGLPVVESVSFGREVFKNSGESCINLKDKCINIGKIYHMHSVEEKNVELDIDSLCSHTFITGSTGKGKSNAIYKIIEELKNKNPELPFLVIEPAKGEYKDAFYHHPSIEVHVFGTNPKEMDLLRINPFEFPEKIHVLEHIDRLSEIFNACWPMYAAMPAILKNAIINAYKSCGWDIQNSINHVAEYPNFGDVLLEIKKILNSSAYSEENKGDYTGALCTRVESLTTGLNGLIFSSNESCSNEELFNNSVIIDLSRVGSPETKSLIMSTLVVKLQEFRMSEKRGLNNPLKHITILEEAHSILKKTSTDQVADNSNITGKAVEVLANAIAEMRSYGEGFIIADQAPNLLDVSVIRNTNTKIVLCLPDEGDRQLVGKSMGLRDEQICELAKLERGVAAVYQNDWLEPVLCKFGQYHKRYEEKDSGYKSDQEQFAYEASGEIKTQSYAKKELAEYLLSKVLKLNKQLSLDNLRNDVSLCGLPIEDRKAFYKIIESSDAQMDIPVIAPYIASLYGVEALWKNKKVNSIEEWNDSIIQSIDPGLNDFENELRACLIQCIMYEQAQIDNTFLPYVQEWKEYMEGKVIH